MEETEIRQPTVYLASPLRANTTEGMLKNMLYARKTQSEIQKCGLKVIATHAWLPLFLNDNDPKERELALSIGQNAIRSCDALIVAGTTISEGVKAEIATALAFKKPVLFYTVEARRAYEKLFKSV